MAEPNMNKDGCGLVSDSFGFFSSTDELKPKLNGPEAKLPELVLATLPLSLGFWKLDDPKLIGPEGNENPPVTAPVDCGSTFGCDPKLPNVAPSILNPPVALI